MNQPFVFPGLAPFVVQAAGPAGFPDPSHLGRALGTWHAGQLQNALGILPAVAPDSQRQILERIRDLRRSLAILLEGIDLAILETCSELELPAPDYVTDRAPEPVAPPVRPPVPLSRTHRKG